MARKKKAAPGKTGLDLVDLLSQAAGSGSRVATLERLGARSTWWVSTGNTALDRVFGDEVNHGIGSKRVIEVWGLSGTGKSLVCLCAAKAMIEAGGIPVYVDMEGTIGTAEARRLGIDPSKMLMIPSPELEEKLAREGKSFTMEEAFAEMEKFAVNVRKAEDKAKIPAEKRRKIIFLYDSIAASPTKMIVEGNYDSHHYGSVARPLGQCYRKFVPLARALDFAAIMVNQERTRVDITFGDKRAKPGGRAAKYYPDISCYLKLIGKVKDGPNVVGEFVAAKIEKNRVCPGRPEAVFRILYDHGVDEAWSIGRMLTDFGLATKCKDKNGKATGRIEYLCPEAEGGMVAASSEEAFAHALAADAAVYHAARERVLKWRPAKTGTLQVEEALE